MGKDIQTNKGFKDKFNKSLVLFNLYLVHVYIFHKKYKYKTLTWIKAEKSHRKRYFGGSKINVVRRDC